MKPDISEFSYGFAVTRELASKHNLIEAPEFPTLFQEGKKGGYDVKMPFRAQPLFLQFKLSDCLSYRSAKEHVPRKFEVPYFRMHLRPLKHSLQHKLLLALEGTGESVYYIAPQFYKSKDFNKCYLTNTVVSNSVFISPSSIGSLPDNDEHYVVFKAGSKIGYLCSDNPEPINIDSYRAVFDNLRNRDRNRQVDSSFFINLTSSMIAILETTEEEHRQQKTDQEESLFDIAGLRNVANQREPIDACNFISRTIFNTELMLVSDLDYKEA